MAILLSILIEQIWRHVCTSIFLSHEKKGKVSGAEVKDRQSKEGGGRFVADLAANAQQNNGALERAGTRLASAILILQMYDSSRECELVDSIADFCRKT